jgi:Protein of unknown function (DUF664)
MTWTAPEIDRLRPPTDGDERAMLQGYLDFHRRALLRKCRGLTAEQLKRCSVEPSSLSLLGLVRHLTEVERAWFRKGSAGEDIAYQYTRAGNLNGCFDDVADSDAERDYAAYRAEIELCDRMVAHLPLEHTFVHPRWGATMSLRWVYLHMIAEYAQHNGHADLLRERLDGVTGD